jgi:hypothetical protein
MLFLFLVVTLRLDRRCSCLANSARSCVIWIRKVLIYEDAHAQFVFALKWSEELPQARAFSSSRAGHVMSAEMTSLAEIVVVIEFLHSTSDPKLRHGEP